MSEALSQPRAAYIEDYNEDAHTTLPETRQTANVAAKRSKPDISRVKVTDRARDEASDSGYSSHTVATLTSGESSLLSKAGSATLTLDTSLVESPAAGKRRLVIAGKQSQTAPQSPQKQSSRRSASKPRPKETVREGRCMCDECWAKGKATGERPAPSAEKSTSKEGNQGKPRLGPHTDGAPASKDARPPSATPASNAAVVQPARPRPRHQGSSQYRTTPRPASFHGGGMPQPMYYPAAVLVGRPPSAFTVQSPFPPPSYPPPAASYFPTSYQHPPPHAHLPPPQAQREVYPFPSSPYSASAQPQPRPWPTEQHQPPQQHIIYSAPPVVECPHASQYSQGFPHSNSATHRTFSERDRERPLPLREEYFPYDEDYYRMPPPPPPPPPKGPGAPLVHYRPAIRHAATIGARALQHNLHMAEDYVEQEQSPRSPRKYDSGGHERSRRPSLASRPSNAYPNEGSHHMDNLEQHFARMGVEGSSAAVKQKRRMTFYGGPVSKDLERQVEDYQAHKSGKAGKTPIPLTADSLKLVRHKTHSSNSETGSRASGEERASRASSDVKPRSVTGRRGSSEVKTRHEMDGFTMRFDASQPVNLDLKGGAKGQTISLRQSKEGDGNIELSIGTKPDAREKSRRRQSYVDGAGVRELEVSRTASRMGRSSGKVGNDRVKERSVAPSRSRRSSKSRGALID
ncbi:MAG: hypothetical protein L6R40_001998 [Gallowayella cf. fulva]|nr:MAG: hypothetical protein L6R40_001998 [Xanthomendoza cf. fulva]